MKILRHSHQLSGYRWQAVLFVFAAALFSSAVQAQVLTLEETTHIYGGERETQGTHYGGAGRTPAARSDDVTALIYYNYFPVDEISGMFIALVSNDGGLVRQPVRLSSPQDTVSSGYQYADVTWDGKNFIVVTQGPDDNLQLKRYSESGEWLSDRELNIPTERCDGLFIHANESVVDLLYWPSDDSVEIYKVESTSGEILSVHHGSGAGGHAAEATAIDDGWAYLVRDHESVRIRILNTDGSNRGRHDIRLPDFAFPGQAIGWNGETLVAISYHNDGENVSVLSYEFDLDGEPVREAVTLQHMSTGRIYGKVNFTANLTWNGEVFLADWDTGSESNSMFEHLQAMVIDAHGFPLSNQIQLTGEPLDQMNHAAVALDGGFSVYSIEQGNYEPSIVHYRLAYDAQQPTYTPTPTPTLTPTPTATATPTPLGENVNQLTIRAYIDGTDLLHVRGSELWYVHKMWAKPGLHDNNNFPTSVNGDEWHPRWSGDVSNRYSNVDPPLPSEEGYYYHLVVNQGRAHAVLVQEPQEQNGYELTILFDDEGGGADWYEVTVLWGPEPFKSLPVLPDPPYLVWRGSLLGIFGTDGLLNIQGDRIETISDEWTHFFTRSSKFSEPLPGTSVDLEYVIHRGDVELEIAEQPRPWNDYTAQIAISGEWRADRSDILAFFTWREVDPEPTATPWPTWNPGQSSPTPIEGAPKVLWIVMNRAFRLGEMWNFIEFRDTFADVGAANEHVIAGEQLITDALLSGYQAVIFGDTRNQPPLSDRETEAVVDFVRGGGSIFVLGQQDSSAIVEDPSRYATSIVYPFGITYGTRASGSARILEDHPLFHRVSSVDSGGSRLTVEPPAIPLATNGDGEVLFAIAEDGYGRVAAYGDETLFAAFNLDENHYHTRNNRQLASNLAKWLLRMDEQIAPTPSPTSTPLPTHTPDPNATPTPTLPGVNLLVRYGADVPPEGIVNVDEALDWTYTPDDFYFVSEFTFEYGDDFQIASGPADLGVGKSERGVVWAALVPHQPATLHSSRNTQPETVRSIYIRMHPATINQLFPFGTVFEQPNKQNMVMATYINQHKFRNSWHAGWKAFVPPEGSFNFDMDLTNDRRRFFYTDLDSHDLQYADGFESRPAPEPMAVAGEDALEIFDEVWDAYDRDYAMFVLRPEVDWEAAKDEYRPAASAATNILQIAGVLTEMLRPLRDLHIWIRVNDVYMPVYSDDVETNANQTAYRRLLGGLQSAGQNVKWAVTPDNIGFLAIHSWSDDTVPSQVDDVLERMKDTAGMIVDVRYNGGGGELLAQEVAGRFADHTYVYAYSRYRNGSDHNDLTDFLPRSFGPSGSWRYDEPVIVLIGPRCMSSNESFVKMMDMCPNVTLMGDNTRGSSGNPITIELGYGLNVSVPRWIDYRSDKVPLDEEGVPPDIRFEPDEDSFTGTNDELLEAALNRLRQTAVVEWMIH